MKAHDLDEHKEAPVEFKDVRETKIREHMVNVHALDYDAVKADLKGHFNEFMADPSAFGVVDPDLIEEIKGVKGLSKHFMWKQFKKAVKLKMEDLAQKLTLRKNRKICKNTVKMLGVQ